MLLPCCPAARKVLMWYDMVQARQRALGNIQFIGHLYRKKMLTEKIMHECIKKLLADVEQPKQEDLECLAKLMSTVGRQLDANPNAKMYMNAYFERVAMLGKNMSLESRIRFMLQVRTLRQPANADSSAVLRWAFMEVAQC